MNIDYYISKFAYLFSLESLLYNSKIDMSVTVTFVNVEWLQMNGCYRETLTIWKYVRTYILLNMLSYICFDVNISSNSNKLTF